MRPGAVHERTALGVHLVHEVDRLGAREELVAVQELLPITVVGRLPRLQVLVHECDRRANGPMDDMSAEGADQRIGRGEAR